MGKPSANEVWNLPSQEFLQLLDSETLVPKPRKIRFYAPSFTYYKIQSFCSSTKDFPTISVTGNSCALNCKHCAGKVLETMHPATSPEKLLNLATKLKEEGARGVLVSGGCVPDGSVPLEKFITTLAKMKRDLGLTVFVHTGILDKETAFQLKDAQIDAALIDVIGSNETIGEIYNLNTTTKHYENSLKALHKAEIPFIPHVIVGLHYGKLKGEQNALNMIQPYNPAAIVIISFMPIHGTTMEKTAPPTPIDIAKITASARLMFSQTPLVLGCMRPKGKHRTETDVYALKAGVNGVAFPSEAAIGHAKKAGYEIGFSSFCCAQIYKDLAAK